MHRANVYPKPPKSRSDLPATAVGSCPKTVMNCNITHREATLAEFAARRRCIGMTFEICRQLRDRHAHQLCIAQGRGFVYMSATAVLCHLSNLLSLVNVTVKQCLASADASPGATSASLSPQLSPWQLLATRYKQPHRSRIPSWLHNAKPPSRYNPRPPRPRPRQTQVQMQACSSHRSGPRRRRCSRGHLLGDVLLKDFAPFALHLHTRDALHPLLLLKAVHRRRAVHACSPCPLSRPVT